MCDFARHAPQFEQTLAARGRTPKTRESYLGALRRFANFVGEIPLEKVAPEQLLAYQRQLASEKLSWSTFNIHTCALRSFYRDHLGYRDWKYVQIPFQKRGRKLPEVLSSQEVPALFEAAPNPKYRTVFMTGYGCGLRLGEILALRPSDIDSKRMVIRVEQGKGRKDRYVMLPERLLEQMRTCWRTYKPQKFLFEGTLPGDPLSTSAVQKAFLRAKRRAGILKHVSVRSLRHAFATHMLEDGTNIRVIQALLGHRSLITTQVYTHLAKTYLSDTKSPLDRMGKEEKTENETKK
jgi:integrase/recombinase XerD